MPHRKPFPQQPMPPEALRDLLAKSNITPSAVGASIQQSKTENASIPLRPVPEVWGILTKHGPDKTPDFYEWQLVEPEDDGTWRVVDDDEEDVSAPYGSIITEDEYGEKLLFDPAVEANGRKAPLGSVVRLVPSEQFVDTDKSISDRYDDHWTDRHWLFVRGESLRPFVLTEDLIPTGGGELDTTVAAEWLDLSFAEGPLSLDDLSVTLFPAHNSGWPAGDQFISLGVGRGPSTYFRGTYGWAKYAPKGTAIGEDENGIIWRGEWQIVTLYAETIMIGELTGTEEIDAGDTGEMNLWWIDKHQSDPEWIDSGYKVKLLNDLVAPIDVGYKGKIHFSRNHYIWTPLDLQPINGMTIYDSGTGQGTTNDYVVVACDVLLNSYGAQLEHVGNTIKNVGNVELIGVVSYKGVGQRDLDPTPPLPGPDAVCHFATFNDGVLIDPSDSKLTSSRRRTPVVPETPAQMGPKAVNSSSGSFTIRLKAGEAIDLRFKHSLSVDDILDTFDTVPGLNMLSFRTVPNVVFTEGP